MGFVIKDEHMKMDNRKGLIQVYTGNGKGKTTSSCGLAIRAIGQGFKVCYIHFHKDPEKWGYGEIKVLKNLGVDIYGFAKKHPHFDKGVKYEEIRKDCLEALEFIKKLYQDQANRYDMLILDEIIISLRDGFLKEKEILKILEKKPPNLELVLTGRGFPESLIEKVDLISETKNIKYPFDKGIERRKGIEF
ncbi:MAG: cob(I)yrinic acid a,c-diamide adenosyltransferase [bacterium]